MIEKGANVNAANHKWQMTPLHYLALVDFALFRPSNWTDADRLGNFNFTAAFSQNRLFSKYFILQGDTLERLS